jgi:signal transduction histidine kinase
MTADQVEEEWIIRVSDNGTGIDPAYQGKIFEPFWKLPKTGAVPGPGLGLTTAREVMKALGGDLALEHSDTTGSRFAIHLPVA